MKKAYMIMGALLLSVMILVSVSSDTGNASAAGKIAGFSAYDMPNDDGAGVILKWTPLDKTHRVIQYNIYRGANPDSLFFLTSIEVDPKMGVMSPNLYYYDRGDQPLIEFESAPTKLKKEKKQAANSPFYQRVPQAGNVVGSLMSSYNMLGVIKNNQLFNRSKMIKLADQTLAGYKLYQFDTVYALPKAGTPYYYSVIAVNEKGNFLPAADIQKVIPVDNRPEPTAVFYSSYIKDKNQFNFEWTAPPSGSDIAMWMGWLLPKSQVESFKQEEAANAQLPDSVYTASWQSSALPLFQLPQYYVAPVYYHTVDCAAEGITLPADLENYTTVLSYMDSSQYQAAALGRSFRLATSAELPRLPKYKVEDKDNDKGDNLVIALGKPVPYVSQAFYLNAKKTKLRLNYDIAKNEAYKIKKIRFHLKDGSGKELGTVTEHFVDHIINCNLPKDAVDTKDIKIEISLWVQGEPDFSTDLTRQHIVYDKKNKRFAGDQIEHNGQVLNELFFDIYSKSATSPMYMQGLRSSAIVRTYDHSIPLPETSFQTIQGYDKATDRFTMNPVISVAADDNGSSGLNVPIYREAWNKQLKDLRDEVSALEKKAAELGAQTPEETTQALAQAKADLAFIESHPAFKAAQAAKSEKEWRKIMVREYLKNSQNYSYRLLVTDGKAMLTLSEPYKNKDGKLYMHPRAEWFDSSKKITLLASILLMVLVVYAIIITRKREVYIRPIAGLEEIDNAVGRATEMGRPVMFVPGWGSLGEVCTIASMMILNQIAKKTAEFDIRLINPHCDYFVMPVAQEMVQSAYSEAGRPDAYDQSDIFFISDNQFPFCAGVNGITIRERVATVFYMGYFNAEALLLTETGNQAGAIQIAATDAVTQVPFFITTCDYTLIGEEFYAASAYLSKNHELVSMLKAQDYFKLVIVIVVIIGALLSTFHMNGFINAFPIE
ncbi:MAG TPA: hypothetical protein P5533_00955 [Candidatus Cloacimonadota bacterium]|nr:hypothetical protein [Candidatus Cloacimonadota bacterium]